MATKNGKQLPKGITWREDKQTYMGRFSFQGKSYTFYNKDLRTLKKTLADKRYEVEHGLAGKATKMTVDTWFSEWLGQYKIPTVKVTSVNHYLNLYNYYVQVSLGQKQLAQIKPVHVQKLYNEMQEKKFSVSTICGVHTLLLDLFQTAVDNDLIVKNPLRGVVLPKAQKTERRVLSVVEQTTLLTYMKREKWDIYEALITVLMGTGLRLGEALGLTWDCVNFEQKEILVKKTLVYVKDVENGTYSFRFQSPKSNAGIRTIPLVTEVANALRRQRTMQMSLRLHAGRGWKNVDGFEMLVFTTSKGTPMQESTVRKALDKVVAEINNEEKALAEKEQREPFVMEHVHPHALRHTFATRAFEADMPPKTVQAFLGHSTLAMTMDLYTHISEEKKREDMDKLEKVFYA